MALVLIVEDSDTVAPLEIAFSSIAQLETLIVLNGRDALTVLQTGSVKLAAVITDLNLPFVDGFELIAAIRAHQRYHDLPVVVVSGDNHPDICRRVRELGANAFFVKPCSPVEIRQTLIDLIHAS